MIKSQNLINFFLIFTFIITIIVNEVSEIDIFLLGSATFIHVFIINRRKFLQNLSKGIVLYTLWISVVMMPAYHLVYHILKLHDTQQVDYNRLVSFGAKVYLISTLSCFIFGTLIKPKKVMPRCYKPQAISNRFIIGSFVFLFILSAFCYVTGLGRMGADAVELPFHLGGIINLFRRVLVPLLFAIVAENYILRGKDVPRKHYIAFGIWTLFEVFAWVSKSIMLTYLEPLAIVLLLYYRPSVKSLAKIVIPVMAVALFLYPIIGAMRNINNGSFKDNITEARNVADEEGEKDDVSPILKPINRTFITAQLYAQDYSYINQDELFDFSRALPIILMRGSAVYQTFVIDGYPPNANHSSGTSGLMDPLLHGGYGLCYVFVVLFMLLAALTDNTLPKKQYSVFVILLLTIWEFCSFRNISSLYDSTGIQTYLVRIVAIYLAYKMNFKRRVYLS